MYTVISIFIGQKKIILSKRPPFESIENSLIHINKFSGFPNFFEFRANFDHCLKLFKDYFRLGQGSN